MPANSKDVAKLAEISTALNGTRKVLNINYQPGEEFSLPARPVERATTTAPAQKPK